MVSQKQIEEETRAILKSINKMPPFPAIITKILNMVQDENYDAKELEEVILLDPVITAKCLKLCNSSYFGMRQKIESIQQAIVLIGQKNLLKIIMAAAAGNLNFNSKGLWMHSVSVAILSQLVFDHVKADTTIKNVFDNNSEFTLYTSSLLHDIGKIVLDQFIERDYHKVEILQVQGMCNCSEIEKQLYGVNHSVIGSEILKKWGFPDSLQIPVKLHHTVFNKMDEKPITAIHIAHILGISDLLHLSFLWCENFSEVIIEQKILDLFHLTPDNLLTLKYELHKQLSETNELLQLDSELDD